MSGKFLICSALVFSLFALGLPAYAAEGGAAKKPEAKKAEKKEEKKPKKEEPKKEEKKGEKKKPEKPEAAAKEGSNPIEFLFPKPDTNLLINTNLIDPEKNDGNVYFLERKPDRTAPVAEKRGSNGVIAAVSEDHSTEVKEAPSRDSTLNGYSLVFPDSKTLAGLRAKGVGDLMVRRGSSSRAIRFYELALKNVPNEADIWLALGNIYYDEKVYRIAASYYRIAAEKYQLPENFGKTKKYRWQSLIRMGYSLEKLKDEENGHREAVNLVSSLREQETQILKEIPDLRDELYALYRMVHGEVYILTPHDFMKPVH